MSNDWSISPGAVARFQSFVVETDWCHLWTGAPNSSGYGVFSLLERGRSAYPAHVLAFEMAEERFVAPDMEVDHTCLVKMCVRRSHLEEVTHAQNSQRANWLTECARGHDLTNPANVSTRTWRNGRECKLCSDQKQRERRAKKREQAYV